MRVGGRCRRNHHLYAASQRPVGADEDKESDAGWRCFSCLFSDEDVLIYGTAWTVCLWESLKQTKQEIGQFVHVKTKCKPNPAEVQRSSAVNGSKHRGTCAESKRVVFFFGFPSLTSWFHQPGSKPHIFICYTGCPRSVRFSTCRRAAPPTHTHSHTPVQHYVLPAIFYQTVIIQSTKGLFFILEVRIVWWSAGCCCTCDRVWVNGRISHPRTVWEAKSESVERTMLGTGVAAVQLSSTDFCSVNLIRYLQEYWAPLMRQATMIINPNILFSHKHIQSWFTLMEEAV